MVPILSLSNFLTVFFAALAFALSLSSMQGRPIAPWRLAFVPGCATMAALMLLVEVIAPTLESDIIWLLATSCGGILGAARGSLMTFSIVLQGWGRFLRVTRGLDTRVATGVILAFSVVDFISAAIQYSPIPPAYVAAGSGGCASFLCGRAALLWWRARTWLAERAPR